MKLEDLFDFFISNVVLDGYLNPATLSQSLVLLIRAIILIINDVGQFFDHGRQRVVSVFVVADPALSACASSGFT